MKKNIFSRFQLYARAYVRIWALPSFLRYYFGVCRQHRPLDSKTRTTTSTRCF